MTRLGVGAVALVAWGVHAVEIVAGRAPWDLLWMCNVAGLVVAAGWFAGSRRALALAASWLTLGVPLWALDALSSGFRAPSVAAHVGGLALAWAGVRRFGWAPGTAWAATAALAGLVAVCAVATPAAANVYLVAAVWPGWEGWFGGHGPYLAALGALAAAVFAAVDAGASRAAR